jgi:hypothetical protein
LKICFILLVYYYTYRFIRFVYSVATTPTDAIKFILGFSGVILIIWAFVRVSIIGRKLLKRLRSEKRERIDIPLKRWLNQTAVNVKQTKIAIAYWTILKYLAGWSGSVTLKFILWPLHSLFEPELETNSIEEFLSAKKLSDNLKSQYGEQVHKRYANWGLFLSAIWSFVSFTILLPVMSWVLSPLMRLVTFMADYWGQLITGILSFIIILFVMTLIFSLYGSFLVGALKTFGKRMDLWWDDSSLSLTPQEPQQQEYQELKEHLTRMMNELMDATERKNKVNEQIRQRERAFARIKLLEPELAGSVGVFVDMVLKEEHSKTEVAERQREKRGCWRDLAIAFSSGFFFLIFGFLLQSDFARSLCAKLLMLMPGK